MKLCFDSIEEVKDFVGSLKGTRGKKGDDAEPQAANQAPAPLQPPAQQQPAFNPPAQVAGFPGAGAAPGTDPAVHALVERIVKRIDGAIASGQPADAVLTWFRGQCGAEAANATMDQIKQSFLPKLAAPALENIAKLMNA